MRKIRLKIDELVVESMETAVAFRRGGTVRGMSDQNCYTLRFDPTCAFYASCDVAADCDGTAVENTCRVNDC